MDFLGALGKSKAASETIGNIQDIQSKSQNLDLGKQKLAMGEQDLAMGQNKLAMSNSVLQEYQKEQQRKNTPIDMDSLPKSPIIDSIKDISVTSGIWDGKSVPTVGMYENTLEHMNKNPQASLPIFQKHHAQLSEQTKVMDTQIQNSTQKINELQNQLTTTADTLQKSKIEKQIQQIQGSLQESQGQYKTLQEQKAQMLDVIGKSEKSVAGMMKFNEIFDKNPNYRESLSSEDKNILDMTYASGDYDFWQKYLSEKYKEKQKSVTQFTNKAELEKVKASLKKDKTTKPYKVILQNPETGGQVSVDKNSDKFDEMVAEGWKPYAKEGKASSLEDFKKTLGGGTSSVKQSVGGQTEALKKIKADYEYAKTHGANPQKLQQRYNELIKQLEVQNKKFYKE